jgi:hypothetical protein
MITTQVRTLLQLGKFINYFIFLSFLKFFGRVGNLRNKQQNSKMSFYFKSLFFALLDSLIKHGHNYIH